MGASPYFGQRSLIRIVLIGYCPGAEQFLEQGSSCWSRALLLSAWRTTQRTFKIRSVEV